MPGETPPRWWGRLLAALFVLGIGVPPMATLVLPERETSAQEKRKLAPPPTWDGSLSGLAALPKGFEKYFNDHFGLREDFTERYNRLKVHGLGVTSNRGVVLGENDWLFYGGGTLDNHRGLLKFPEQALFTHQFIIEGKRDWLAERGIRYLYVLVPDKRSIYTEHFPARFNRLGPTLADQIVTHLDTWSDLDVLDLRPVMEDIKARTGKQLFSRTDSHWNALGAYYGYRAIMERLSAWYPELSPRPLSDFDIVHEEQPGGDLAGMLGIKESMRETEIKLIPKTPPCDTLVPFVHPVQAPTVEYRHRYQARVCDTAPPIRLLMMRDSFATLMLPHLAGHFAESTFIWQNRADFLPRESFPLITALAERDRPHVVIDQMLERKFPLPVQLTQTLYQSVVKGAFARSRDVRLARRFGDGPPPVKGLLGGQVGAGEDGWKLRVGAPGAQFAVGPFTTEPGTWAVARVTVEAPGPIQLALAPGAITPQGLATGEPVVRDLPAGTSSHTIALGQVNGRGVVLLQPGLASGSVILKRVEVRGVTKPLAPNMPGT